MAKVIITAALTGNMHVPSMSPYLPLTPQQIVDEAVRSRDAGAAIVHVHARNPEDGMPTTSLNVYGEILSGIKKRSDIVICVTTGGTSKMTAEERIAVVKRYKPEMASFNMGSMNFATYPVLDKIKKFKYPWEEVHLRETESFVFTNHFKMLKHFFKTMRECETKPELEIYDVGMINNVAQMIKESFIEKPLCLQFVMGILGGIPATLDNLLFLYNTAERMLTEFHWSVCAAGRYQFPIGVTNMILGGNMRVGLEDNLYIERGVLAKSNAEQVEKAARFAKQLGLDIATPDEAREIMGLKGTGNVSY